jgi:1,4-dihydroxy-2-naphthoyl-CoA hydrolase
LEKINEMSKNTLAAHLGIRFTAIGEDFIEATMPVDNTTRQPFGLLHGGASLALSETMGSVGSVLSLDPQESKRGVGLEINANHIRSVTGGLVTGTARPIHLGRSTQVWEIRITDEKKNLLCISRLTVAIVKAR